MTTAIGRLAAEQIRAAAAAFPNTVEIEVTPPDPRALTVDERRRAVLVLLGVIDQGGTSHV